VGKSVEAPIKDFDMTLSSLYSILEYIRIHNPKAKLIYPSSAAVYGNAGGVLSEDDNLNPISPYGLHKVFAEQLCKYYSGFHGLKIGVLRIFSIYGEGLRKQILWDACTKFSSNENMFWGTGNESRDFIAVCDLCEAICLVLDKQDTPFDIYNCASGNSITIGTILNEIGLHYNMKPEFNGNRKEGDPDYMKANIDKLSKLGFMPKVTLKKGVGDYVKWFKEEKCLK
jgi:UDP-glucose 4-epimerase